MILELTSMRTVIDPRHRLPPRDPVLRAVAPIPAPPGRSDLRARSAPELDMRPMFEPGRFHGERGQRRGGLWPVLHGIFGRDGDWYVNTPVFITMKQLLGMRN